MLYVAGADPYLDDQLGGLTLTLEGLMERDRLVIRTALTHGSPVAIVLAGGYAENVEDTITIHANTAAVAGGGPSGRPVAACDLAVGLAERRWVAFPHRESSCQP